MFDFYKCPSSSNCIEQNIVGYNQHKEIIKLECSSVILWVAYWPMYDVTREWTGYFPIGTDLHRSADCEDVGESRLLFLY